MITLKISNGELHEVAFSEFSKPETLVIPETVHTIGSDFVFWSHANDKISSVVMQDSVITIDEAAFYECKSLKSIALSPNLKQMHTYKNLYATNYDFISNRPIGFYDPNHGYDWEWDVKGAFGKCSSLESVIIPGSVEVIDVCCFANCERLEQVEIQEGAKILRDYAFAECPNLREVFLPNSLEVIEQGAFKDCCSLGTLYLSPSIRLIEDGAFQNCRNLIISCTQNSYAEQYAKKNGLKTKESFL